MTEADILATTYEDTVTVYRAFKDTLPGGESVFKSGLDGKVVYEDVECALSTHTGGKLQQSKSTAKTETTFCLFTRPEVDIQTNDFLVITHFGKKIEAVVRTESSYFSNQGELASYREMGIQEYTFLGGGCEICMELNGQSFPLDEAEPGLNLPPIHPNCKCTIKAKAKIDLFKDREGVNPLESKSNKSKENLKLFNFITDSPNGLYIIFICNRLNFFTNMTDMGIYRIIIISISIIPNGFI